MQKVELNAYDLRALEYIINTGHTATIEGFDDDHEPIGPTLRKKLVPRFMSEHEDGRLRLTEQGMERAMEAKYGRR